MTKTALVNNTYYHHFLLNSTDIELYELDADNLKINPQFKSLEKWVKILLGPATAEFHNLKDVSHPAIKDENRNAILPGFNTQILNKDFYLSVKGCGAYEDMFFGGKLTPSKLQNACRDPTNVSRLKELSTGLGFIMGESWMGESPYGAQGHINAFDELDFSMVAKDGSINGAHLCPVIGVVQLPPQIELMARKFFWFRTYEKHFYQVLRLVPSNIRLYFESEHVIANPSSIFSLFEINTAKTIEDFELNFIKSGIALLTLYSRSAKLAGNEIKGIIYQDVWLDKDCIVAPDGIIHFADIEGLIWKSVLKKGFVEIQKQEWQKLVYEFLYALFKVDTYRHIIEERKINWETQREELALLISQALSKDLFCYAEHRNGDLVIKIEVESFPVVEIPLIEMVNF